MKTQHIDACSIVLLSSWTTVTADDSLAKQPGGRTLRESWFSKLAVYHIGCSPYLYAVVVFSRELEARPKDSTDCSLALLLQPTSGMRSVEPGGNVGWKVVGISVPVKRGKPSDSFSCVKIITSWLHSFFTQRCVLIHENAGEDPHFDSSPHGVGDLRVISVNSWENLFIKETDRRFSLCLLSNPIWSDSGNQNKRWMNQPWNILF